MIDLHTHILPGLDDGARDMDHALRMARTAVEDGTSRMVGTPHLLRGSYGIYDLSRIPEIRDELNDRLKKEQIGLEVYSGAEVRISHALMPMLKNNREFMVINNGSYMFLEFPSDHIFSGVKQVLFDVMSEELRIIIAHPERNSVFRRQPSVLFELLELGCLCQANAGSILGVYGKEIQESVFHFLDWKMIHFIASDGHNTHSLKSRFSEAVKKAGERVGEEKAALMAARNPEDVLENREISYRPDPVDPSAGKKSLKIRVPGIFKRR